MNRDERLSKLKQSMKRSVKSEDAVIYVHYLFCKKFGWIHPDEFNNLPYWFVEKFMDLIKEDNKRLSKYGNKGR